MSSAPNEGRQSPPPETQSGRQLKETPASGQGIDEAPNKKESMQDQLSNLTSNPKGPLEDAVTEKFSKTTKPS
ncbi:hypothetical protein F4815DRAFT_454991 [Daldinia loculata]|uniref:uncharacterized protein n=1 Tax=Daldinia loculata TaxID=103429 RepID=UPI0020C28A1B|nr:uncharacterized protein F4817DRAFT_176399 [Daldinia loculata]KAI1651104.1 hypothetical protein F4817DRAFT_176399 [Daldinia loculata]KAI2784223.1 hypothetical protein F4815DRAFT_454991 [Daldinia loculata]